MNKFVKIGLAWIGMIFCYIILANIYPAFTGLADQAASALQSTSNMSNYPGMLAGVQSAPLWVWFIPGGVVVVATAVWLREDKEN